MKKYKFLYIGRGFLMPSIPYKLKKELGHEVVFFASPYDDKKMQEKKAGKKVETYQVNDTYEKMGLKVITDIKQAMPYFKSKEWIKVFEDTQLTHLSEPLIRSGQPVLGGYKEIEEWETDRDKGMKICSQIEEYNDKNGKESYNIRVLPQEEFSDFDKAIKFVEQNPARWVIKEAGDSDIRALNYKGELESGMDVISRLEYLKEKGFGGEKNVRFFLQKRVHGIETAVSAFFNGKDFMNWTEVDFEHQPLLAGDRGPNTGEMMNEAWGIDKEENPLFKAVYEPLKKYLRQKGFRGFMNLNGMIDEAGYHPFEWTIRMAGCPWVTQLYTMIEGKYDYGQFLADLAYGNDSKIEWHEGYTFGVRVDVPPTLYAGMSYDYLKKNMEEDKKLTPELQSLLKKDPNEFVTKLKEYDSVKENSYEMPVTISNFHPEKEKHFFWGDAKNLKVKYVDGVPYGIVEPTGTCFCYITERGHRPKVINQKIDNIIESMAGLSFICRDDYGDDVEENLSKLESWGYNLWPKSSMA